jgi:hypothetical protein
VSSRDKTVKVTVAHIKLNGICKIIKGFASFCENKSKKVKVKILCVVKCIIMHYYVLKNYLEFWVYIEEVQKYSIMDVILLTFCSLYKC